MMNQEDRNKAAATHFQDTATSWTDRYTGGHDMSPGFLVRRKAVLEQLARVPREEGKPRRAIDIGCGTGPYLPFLAEMAGEVVGIDVAPAMIEQARQNLPAHIKNVTLQTASVLALPFPPAHFDTGVCVGVLEYFDSPVEVLRALFSALSPGGCIVCTLPSVFGIMRSTALPRSATLLVPPRWKIAAGAWKDRLQGRAPDPSKYYLGASFTFRQVRRLCQEAGLEVSEITSSGFDGLRFAGLPVPGVLASKVDEMGENGRQQFPWKYLGNNLIVTMRRPK